jgi:glycosyltransferase involved in cell wall biosynthesis
MKLTVLFATHNGSYTLPLMMDSFLKLKIIETFSLDIVAVCNNCNDDSERILESYCEKLNIKVVQENRPGKNIALNTGIKYVQGDAVIIVDDDIIVDENWLIKYAVLFETQKDISIFGGTIAPFWVSPASEGLIESIPVEMAYALTSNEYQTGEIDATRLFGPNMAVRKDIFDAGFSFSEDIGPASDNKNYVTGSETEFLKRCQKAGYRAYFDSNCIVHHIIRPWQMTQSWLNNRAFKGGKSVIEMQIGSGNIPAYVYTVFGYPRWCIIKVFKLRIKALLKTFFGVKNANELYKLYWDMHATRGYAYQYRINYLAGKISR